MYQLCRLVLKILFLSLWSGFLISYAQDKETPPISSQPPDKAEIKIDLKQLNTTQKGGKDIIELTGSSNLPSAVVLNTRLLRHFFSLLSPEQEKTIMTKYLTIDNQHQFKVWLSGFERALPVGIYTVKLDMAERQSQVLQSIYAPYLGKTIWQQKLVLGDLRNLVTEVPVLFKKLDETLTFLGTVADELGKFGAAYHQLSKNQSSASERPNLWPGGKV